MVQLDNDAGGILVSYDDGDCGWAEKRDGEWTDANRIMGHGAPLGKATPSDVDMGGGRAPAAAASGLTLREIFEAKMQLASAATTVRRSPVGSHEGPQSTTSTHDETQSTRVLDPVKRNLSCLLTAIGLFV